LLYMNLVYIVDLCTFVLFINNQHFIAEVSKKWLAHERYEKIVDLLRKNKAIKVSSVTKLFCVST
ncbi:hypothetical protein ABFV99_23780, partial [Cytobacillus horneckiae]|uniref:hypothetical protein n=1 Tax=Cytobacillus horneckiae TaxID=549687 RepID=UPI0034CF24B0